MSWVTVVLVGIAVGWAEGAAFWHEWICDDAFISFRYADHLVRGLGLVFNRGERVEGYTNFLWTVWIALGMKLGSSPERWAIVSGVTGFGAIAFLLARRAARRAGSGATWLAAFPIAALLAAAMPDWNIYATSGLETSLFTLLALAGFLALVQADRHRGRLAFAGVLLALAALTRPDGVIFVALGGLWVVATARPRLPAAVAFGLPALAILVPFEAWRWWYYGDLVPNTFHAKSANLAWYSQGWIYLRLFFTRYWVLPAGVVLAAVAAWRGRAPSPGGATTGLAPSPGAATADLAASGPPAAPADGSRDRWVGEASLAALFALGYSFYVMRVGGDFMHARLLIPAAPFFLILLELAIVRLAGARGAVVVAAGVAALAAVVFSRDPLPPGRWVSGIVSERQFYTPAATASTRREGLALRRYFDGLPIRVAFVGSQAGLVYYARPAVAIESQTGLTDRYVARQPLARRGRVGHEKLAPLDYLVEKRGAHIVLHYFASVTLGLDDYLPYVVGSMDSTWTRLLTWDPQVVAELRRRGARFPDFPAALDGYIALMNRFSDAQVRLDYEKARHFYFERVSDPARERPFRERLGIGR